MKGRRICVVITARASYARVKTVLEGLKGRDDVSLSVVAVGESLNGYPDTLLTACEVTGCLVQDIAGYFDLNSPDLVVTIADRYETLATAIAAAYQNIPLAHLQGGEWSGNIDQKVRYAVTALSDYHFVATQRAGYRVGRILELSRPKGRPNVWITGCPSIDLAARAEGEAGSGQYIVVLEHPVTNLAQEAGAQMRTTLEALRMVDMPAVFVGPNPDAGNEEICKAIRFIQPDMPPQEFMSLIKKSRCLVGNSSMGIRECSYLGTPAVNIGDRQTRRERAGNVMDVDYDGPQIAQAIELQVAHGPYPASQLYGDGKAGEHIARLLARIVNENVKHG